MALAVFPRGCDGAVVKQGSDEEPRVFRYVVVMTTDDELITLDVAASLIPGADAGTLKRKIRAGKLRAYRPGKKYLTTRADVKRLIESCLVVQKAPVSGFVQPSMTTTESSPTLQTGLSSTAIARRALDLALEQVKRKKSRR